MTYGVSWGFASVGMATIVPIAFKKFYDFGIVQEGLVFIVVLVGVIVGGQAAGLVCDWVMQKDKRRTERQGRSLSLERRL